MSTGKNSYETYRNSVGGKDYYGYDLPTWAQLIENTPGAAKAWETAKEDAARIAGDEGSEARFSFPVARHLIESGRKVVRAGWNEVGRWLELVRDGDDLQGDKATIGLRNNINSIVVPWSLPTNSDIVADDWMIVDDKMAADIE